MNPGEQNYWQGPREGEGAQPAATSTNTVDAPSNTPATAQPTTSPVAAASQQAAPVPAAPVALPPVQQTVPPKAAQPEAISWEASEFIHHAKGVSWFLGFTVFAVALLAFGLFVLKDYITTGGFVIMLIAIAVVAVRPPRTLKYVIDEIGVHVGDRTYGYQQFQSFGVLQEGGIWSVLLMPTGRFQPPLSLYFSRDIGEKIVDILSSYLPMEDHKPDLVDRLASRFRF